MMCLEEPETLLRKIYESVVLFLLLHCSPLRSVRLGKFLAKSGRRARTAPQSQLWREMDWALFEVFKPYETALSNQAELLSGWPPTSGELRLSQGASPVPGAFVKSSGRKSGYQLGQISTTRSAVYHKSSYVTEEWGAIKRPETPIHDWIEGGGIGVEGDSGGLIVDEETHEVYGMLWGRVGRAASTVTLFTPIREILQDIIDTTGHVVEFVARQAMHTSMDTAAAIPVPDLTSLLIDALLEHDRQHSTGYSTPLSIVTECTAGSSRSSSSQPLSSPKQAASPEAHQGYYYQVRFPTEEASETDYFQLVDLDEWKMGDLLA
ncbi:hypothetical protein LZ554_003253 [Drepanopeziza brunnea f. sp. 'monogermtubi']|nr:hypothetical protein LZ554_003253 [Drepanopeziza brunnea f. sp. 'monogermtubi']